MSQPPIPPADPFPQIHAYLDRVQRGDSIPSDEVDRFLNQIGALHRDVHITFHRWWHTGTAEYVLAIFLGILITGAAVMTWNFIHSTGTPLEIDCRPCLSQSGKH